MSEVNFWYLETKFSTSNLLEIKKKRFPASNWAIGFPIGLTGFPMGLTDFSIGLTVLFWCCLKRQDQRRWQIENLFIRLVFISDHVQVEFSHSKDLMSLCPSIHISHYKIVLLRNKSKILEVVYVSLCSIEWQLR